MYIFIVSDSRRPWFPEPVPNVTVIVGKDALLTCVVQDLHHFKVNRDVIIYIQHTITFNGIQGESPICTTTYRLFNGEFIQSMVNHPV